MCVQLVMLHSARYVLHPSHIESSQECFLILTQQELSGVWQEDFLCVFIYFILFYLFFYLFLGGARCSSVVKAFAHGAMGRRIDPSWGGPLSYFSFQPVLHDWCNKGRGMCYPVCGMMHINETLAANRKV